MEKKTKESEFNKEWFDSWKKIKAIHPHIEEWSDEEGENKVEVLSELEIEFDNGEKILIQPYSNKEETSLDDEDNPICCALNLFTYDKKLINFKQKGGLNSSQP
jgi:hypothetical protein